MTSAPLSVVHGGTSAHARASRRVCRQATKAVLIATCLLGAGEYATEEAAAQDCLRVGAELDLRRGQKGRMTTVAGPLIEIAASGGRALGYLPPDDAMVVAQLLDAGATLSVKVTAAVPAHSLFGRSRVQLLVEATPVRLPSAA